MDTSTTDHQTPKVDADGPTSGAGHGRRGFLGLAAGTALAWPTIGAAASASAKPKKPRQAKSQSESLSRVEATADIEGEIAWYDVADWGVEGRGWDDTASFYDRFPARAEESVPSSVWNLSQQSAGMLVRFVTDSPVLHARYSLRSERLAMPHMPATGVSGLDVYGRTTEEEDRWVAVAQPKDVVFEGQLVEGLDPGVRLYTAYLPLYNGLDSLQIGAAPDAIFEGVRPRTTPPAIFYGTSIIQGGVASRPGMAIPAILGRQFDCPTINLGFSGSGKMDAPVGDLLAELEASVYVIDCSPNMTPAMITERTEPLVEQLRQARKETPILLVEDRTLLAGTFVASARELTEAKRAALRQAYQRLRASGMRRLHYLAGDDLLGQDGEGTVDGSHPTDLGAMRYCDAYERALRPILRPH